MDKRSTLQSIIDWVVGPPPAPPLADVPPAPAPPPPPAIDFDDKRIPAAAKEQAHVILGLIADLESRATGEGIVNTELIELEQMKTRYLPKLLVSYAEIPPEHRAEIFRSTGKSASFMLGERLDKMIERLREISRLLAQGHLDAFTANMQFIDTRFSKDPFE